MNRGLLVVAATMIVGGAATGTVALVVFGLIFAAGGIIASPRAARGPSGTMPRVKPSEETHAETRAEPVPVKEPIFNADNVVRSTHLGSEALFPSPILPTLSQIEPANRAKQALAATKEGEKYDEILVGAVLLGVLKLLSRKRQGT